jgi:hypothetical protein
VKSDPCSVCCRTFYVARKKSVVVFIKKLACFLFSPHQSCLYKILSNLYHFLPQELHCRHIPLLLHWHCRCAQVKGNSSNFVPYYMLIICCEIACCNFRVSIDFIVWVFMLVSYFQRSYVFMLVICFRFNFECCFISGAWKNIGSTLRLGTIEFSQNN